MREIAGGGGDPGELRSRLFLTGGIGGSVRCSRGQAGEDSAVHEDIRRIPRFAGETRGVVGCGRETICVSVCSRVVAWESRASSGFTSDGSFCRVFLEGEAVVAEWSSLSIRVRILRTSVIEDSGPEWRMIC